MDKENNWILDTIKKSLNKNGYLTEENLKLLRTHLQYKREFVSMKKHFEDSAIVQAYLFMMKEIDMVNKTVDYVTLYGCKDHILVKNDDNYICLRCGIDFKENDLNNSKFQYQFLPFDIEYSEAQKLYDRCAITLDEPVLSYEIVNAMRYIHDKNKVYKK